MSANRIGRIRSLLLRSFAPEDLEIADEGHLHAGHEGAKSGKGHFRVRIVSERFRNKRPIERHRMVYKALGDMMETDIHAVSVTALTPDET